MGGQLKAIHGLDPISWWPLAPGWWISALLILLSILIIALFIRHLINYPPGSWRKDAREALRQLRRASWQQSPKETVGELSELLRRIGMARFGRRGLASLSGPEWLEWLHHSDPNDFDWLGRGKILLSLPYAPEERAVDQGDLDVLITAALRLVGSSKEDVSRRRQKFRIRRFRISRDV
jgi:hypothetical protein